MTRRTTVKSAGSCLALLGAVFAADLAGAQPADARPEAKRPQGSPSQPVAAKKMTAVEQLKIADERIELLEREALSPHGYIEPTQLEYARIGLGDTRRGGRTAPDRSPGSPFGDGKAWSRAPPPSNWSRDGGALPRPDASS